jgi:nicotinate-nucleotide adenylyltransferase
LVNYVVRSKQFIGRLAVAFATAAVVVALPSWGSAAPARVPDAAKPATDAPARAAGERTGALLTRMSDGSHSLQRLGAKYSRRVPIRKIEGARLVLFNSRLAQALGLDLPSDPAELERVILERFAYVIAKKGEPSERAWMATYYQDSNGKEKGEARGDGRALWSGEIELRPNQKNNHDVFPIDVVVKGVGQTPLAWTNHDDPGHKDGLQSLREAVHSFIMSEANDRNELNTTMDLAVIEIPVAKKDKHSGQQENAALTVRVGEQTRIAHLRYWADRPTEFKKLFDYVVNRALHRPQETPIQTGDYDLYIQKLATNLADEAARYYDLHAVHASPTPGNRTTSGATIDLGTFRYLDTHHADYTYLFDQLSLGGKYGQREQMKDYIALVEDYALDAGIEFSSKPGATFTRVFNQRLLQLWMQRLGLPEGTKLKRETKLEIVRLFKELSESVSDRLYKLGDREFHPAQYDMRRIFEGIPALVNAKTNGEALAQAKSLLQSNRPWAEALPQTIDAGFERYQATSRLVDLVDELRKEVPNLKEVMRQNAFVHANRRDDLGPIFVKKYESPIVEKIQKGDIPFTDLTSDALAVAQKVVDPGLAPNRETNLGPRERVGFYSGTFDPPHAGHHEIVQKMIEMYRLDRIYILVNPSSPHKTGVSSFADRKAMSIAQFSDLPQAVVADSALTRAFEKGDVDAVLTTIEAKHPTAQIYHVMGEDSFARLVEVAKKRTLHPHPRVTILVNPREAVRLLPPAYVAGSPVVVLPQLGEGLSSTAIRDAFKQGQTPRGLKEKVIEHVNRRGLYRAPRSCEVIFGGAA